MTNEPLAPIFLDNKPINLKDPKPMLATVLSAGGRPGATQVKRLQAATGDQGTLLDANTTLDRTSEPTKPIFLSSLARGVAAPVQTTAPPAKAATTPAKAAPTPGAGYDKGKPVGDADAPSARPWTAGAQAKPADDAQGPAEADADDDEDSEAGEADPKGGA